MQLKKTDEEYIVKLENALVATVRFIEVEARWEGFRAEFLAGENKEYKKSSEQNANKLGEYLRQILMEFPQLQTRIMSW